jgi:hypothetical protein
MRARLSILMWEWLQNAPAVLGVVIGLQCRARGEPGWAAGLAAAGGVLSALVIRWTEGRKQEGGAEPYRLTLANAIGFALGSMAMTWYLGAGTPVLFVVDLGLGAALGLGLSVWQERAARGSTAFSDVRSRRLHRIAFMTSFPVVLVLLRLTARLDVVWALLSVVPISLLLSVVIALIDYGGGTHGNAGAGS